MSKNSISVLHCPENVASNPQVLCQHERKLGFRSWLVSFKPHAFGYHTDEILFGKSPVANELKRYLLFLRGLFFYDVIHFNFGSTIFRSESFAIKKTGLRGLLQGIFLLYCRVVEQKDLVLFHFFGKTIFVTFQGDDARQGLFCEGHFKYNFVKEAGYYTPQADQGKRRRIGRFEKYADKIYALNPDLLHVLPVGSEFLPYGNIDIFNWNPSYPSEGIKIPHVVHAPSHRGVKGSRYVIEAFEKLKANGVDFTFTLVEGKTHEEARRIYESADLLVDQVLVGWYGGLSVELMALGKPVICYIREEDLKFVPTEMKSDIPIINANPDTVYDILLEWLTVRKSELNRVGMGSRKYVEKWHDPNIIASKVTADYKIALNK